VKEDASNPNTSPAKIENESQRRDKLREERLSKSLVEDINLENKNW